MTSTQDLRIGFVGGGNMAQAIIRGLINAGHQAGNISVSDPSAEQRAAIRDISESIVTGENNQKIAGDSDTLVLAVKPQIIRDVAVDLARQARPDNQVVVSIAAGVTLDSLLTWFGPRTAAVRVMPNQPSLVGSGMSGLCATSAVSESGREAADYLMRATGKAIWFSEESLMDAVTAISGSGPAYFYLFMEIMEEIGIEFGFSPDTARLLSTQTALGAAEVASGSDESLQDLRRRVTSPGGTTAAALDKLESAGIRDIFRAALVAARNRSMELGAINASDNGN